MNRLFFIFGSLIVLSCNSYDNTDHQNDYDIIQNNFIEYVEKENINNNEFLIFEYKKCHYCDDLIEVALENNLLSKNQDLTLVVSTYEQPKGKFFKKYSNLKNFLIYESYKGFPQLLDDDIRHYQVLGDTVILNSISVSGFEEFLLSKLNRKNVAED